MAKTMHEGVPRSYWRFRNVFSTIQMILVAGVLTAAAIWGFHDGKVIRFSAALYEFAKEQLVVWFV